MFKNINRALLFVLFAIITVLFLNFSPGTYLTGWDNLHPELNFELNINRSIFAVWQEYQGLGLLGGMGHASDLFRQLTLWLSSFVLPTNYLRYLFHFLMLSVGPLGVYFLLSRFVFTKFETKLKNLASLIGAIFYLFNLATLQMFYVPFEPYSTHFAFLPWLFLTNLNFLGKSNKKSLVLLLLANLLSISQGYVATFFLVYFIALSFTFSVFLLHHKKIIKMIAVAYSILFFVNAFWLFPNLYFVVKSAGINVNSKMNQMATENNILQNKKYGNLTNTTLLKGFWFENMEVEKTNRAKSIMGDWANHFDKPTIRMIGYLIFVISILGLLISIKQKIKGIIVFIPVFLFGFVILSNDTPILSIIATLFYQLPLVSQIFRTPFTKLALLVAFCLSIFYPVLYITIAHKIKRKFLNYLMAGLFIIIPIIFLYPIFQGHLFYEKNKIEIPQEYFQIFDFFSNQPKNTRIANFPQSSYWGWTKYGWNYGGSGFLWYGIEQPILDRAFDVWSDKNENYYWEISYALYSKNQELFEKVLEKYQINWLLVDGNVINPSSPKALYFDELEYMISKSDKISIAQEFEKIKIYQVELETPVKNFVFLTQNLPQVEPVYNWNNYDQAYLENGNYYSLIGNLKFEIGNLTYYPFRSLFTGRTQEDLEFEIVEESDYFALKNEIPNAIKEYQLIIPEEENKELVYVDPNDFSKVELLQPEVKFEEAAIEVKVPKVTGLYSSEIEPIKVKDFTEAINCQEYLGGQVENEIIKDGGNQFLRLKATDAKNCGTSFWLPNLNHQLSYLITIEARHVDGKSLLFWIENHNSRKADLETFLPKIGEWQKFVFIQPAMEEDGLGYSLHFDNISIGREESVNDLGKITVIPFPFKFLTSLKLVNPQAQPITTILLDPVEVYHPNPSYYVIHQSPTTDHQSQILVLSQAYHDDWLAWQGKPFTGKRLEHVLVNNWQNGWIIEEEGTPVYIFFWPQLLEYFGFFLLLVTLTGVGVYCLKKK